MLVKHLNNYTEMQQLKEKEFELQYYYKKCVDSNNIEDARVISKKLLTVSREIMKLNHKINYTI